MNAVAKTYRYLDAEEVAQARREAQLARQAATKAGARGGAKGARK
jgi:hypothetical protein